MAEADGGLTWEEKVDFCGITLLVPFLAVWVPTALHLRPEVAWRSAGGVLELAGFVTAAVALTDKLSGFPGHPSVWGRLKRVKRWFRQLLEGKRERRTVTKTISEKISATGSFRATVKPGRDASVEHRVEILERELESVRSWIKDAQKECREGRTELEKSIDAVRNDLREVERSLEGLLKRVTIGSLRWEAVGLFWFVLGVVASTWAGQLPSL